MYKKIIILFEYFYQIVSGNRIYEFKPREREQKMIDNFLKLVKYNYGDDWLFNYFCFQFGRYSKMKTQFGKGKIMLNWIIGKKSFDHYLNASDGEKYYGEEFKLDFNLQNPLKKEVEVLDNDYLDLERRRFYNTDLGLLHCSQLNLFKENNKNCRFCKNKNYCKDASK